MSTEKVQTNSPNVLSSSQVVRELTTFYFYHQIQNKIKPNFFLSIFLFQEKPQSHPKQSEVGGKPRAASIRTTRSSKGGETHSVPPAAYVSSQQLQKKAANRRRQNAKKTGGEIFCTLPAVNVSVSAVKVFIVVLIICCHSDNFMIRNETLV